MSIMLYSFDVFDTALTRIWAKPTDLFYRLGQHLSQGGLISYSPEEWSQLRILTEAEVRQLNPGKEVTLQQIYEKLAIYCEWTGEHLQFAMQRELDLELTSLRPVLEIQTKIRALHQAQQQVLFLSDMYLPTKKIEQFLRNHEIWKDGDRLYVSSEMGGMKANGELFKYCLLKESIPANQLSHTGDNMHSDIKVAQQLGINAVPFIKSQLNRYEKIVSDNQEIPFEFRSLLAGASRLARLQCQEKDFKQKVIWDVGASVIGPTLVGFVYWCLIEAERREIKRLYFLARDGQILHKIAKILCEKWGFAIDCRYLYGSRQAWHFPAIQGIGEVELDWIFDPTYYLSVESVCERANIKPDQIETVLLRYGFPKETWAKNLFQNERNFLRQAFQEPEVCSLIVSLAANYRHKTIGYFQQEGLSDFTKFAIVDIGWNGRLQRSLSNLLRSAGMYPSHGTYGFYFGLSKRLRAFPTDTLLAYFSDCGHPVNRNQICHYRNVFELFCAADHGGTVRFEEINGQYLPILRTEKNENALQWGLITLQNSVLEFARQLCTSLHREACSMESFLLVNDLLLTSFINQPMREESEVFGSFRTSEDQADNIDYTLAPQLSLRGYLVWLTTRNLPHSNVWLPGSIANSHWLTKSIFQSTITIKYELKQMLTKIYGFQYTLNILKQSPIKRLKD
jgi:FMN phosphatase YigB (HAD superfamily)